jgi:hypothetical protein
VSQDKELNAFGKLLLEFCWCHDMQIINGNTAHDAEGKFTYLSSHGHSVVDYFLVSNDLCCSVQNLVVHDEITSDHMPVVLKCRAVPNIDTLNNTDQPVVVASSTEKFFWCTSKSDQVKRNLTSEEFSQKLIEAEGSINSNPDNAVYIFTEALLESALCMRRTIQRYNRKNVFHNAKWFDKDCLEQKKKVKGLLKSFRRCKTSESYLEYEAERKIYNALLKNKKVESKRAATECLVNSSKNSQVFWNEVKKHKQKKFQTNRISNEAWIKHFEAVFNGNNMQVDIEHPSGLQPTEEDIYDDVLDAEISESEIRDAIRRTKCGKAPGPDNILAEVLKLGENEIVNFLCKLFNQLLTESKFPIEWTKATITPLHKKGDKENPDNYRGISLLSILSKVFTGIINKRLNEWTEANEILNDVQAGFRKGRSTVDHIFTLNALIEKQFSKNMKFYVAFIDFKKAYDTVDRPILYAILFKAGIQGKMLKLIKSMYQTVQACVRGSYGTTEYFKCMQGLKQGCILSPILFSILINELANDIINNGRHGVSLSAHEIDLFLLLFADDLTLLAVTITGLQNQLNVLRESATRLGLVVNMEKSQIIVFRKGGFLAAKEKWYFGIDELKVVNQYKYLGLIFSSKLSFIAAIEEMAAKGKKSTVEILRTLRRIDCNSPGIFFKLFDAQVLPVLLYGAEIWGHKIYKKIEQIHLFACKRFLRITDKTPNDVIYGELGRHPLWIESNLRCIKYWFRLINQPDNMYSKKAYCMLAKLDDRGTTTWVTNIRNLFCYYGFELVWLFGCGNKHLFCQIMKERMINDFCHRWRNHIDNSDSLKVYSIFKDTFGREKYIDVLNVEVFRRGFAQLRAGVSQLNAHRFRFNVDDVKKRCPFCATKIESTVHFLLHCPKYESLRRKYLAFACSVADENLKLKRVFNSEKGHEIIDIARYIKFAFSKRNAELVPIL